MRTTLQAVTLASPIAPRGALGVRFQLFLRFLQEQARDRVNVMFRFFRLGVAAIATLAASVVNATFMIEDFSVLQSVTVGPGAKGGYTVGDGTTSCWHMVGCYRDIVIDNTAALHATTASVQYNANTPTIGPNYEFTAHVAAGDLVRFIITWDTDTVSGNFGSLDDGPGHDFPVTYPAVFFPYMYSSGGQAGYPQLTLTMKDVNGKLSTVEYSAFDRERYRPDGYVAPALIFGWCGRYWRPDPAIFDCDHLAGMQAVVAIHASDQAPVDFALRRLKAPEPSSLALAGLALLGLAAIRRTS